MLVFVGLFLALICLVYFYLWKRLVQDPLTGRLQRRIGAVVAVVPALLVPVTLVGARTGWAGWVAWPGFLWIALMFYLLVTLVVLEVPRLVIVLLWRRSSSRTEKGVGKARAGADGSSASTGHEIPTGGRTPTTDAMSASGQTTNGEGNADVQPSSGGVAAASGDGGVGRRLVLARGMAIFAGLTAASVTGYGVKTALGPPQINRVRIPLAKLPRAMDQTRLVLVSDIHLGPLTGTRHVGRIVELINSVDADLVCIVGDLVDGTVAELGKFATPLRDIRSRRGAYFVTGNHEYYSGFQPWIDEVRTLGVRPLRNERIELDGLDLAGVNDLGGVDYDDGPDFGRALGDRDRSRPVVLMAHQPIVAHQAAPFGVDLQVSGHTHGGQMAPFNLLVKLQQPVVSGLGHVDGVPVFVTNGAGFWGPPVRVGAPPQVTVIELRAP